MTKLIHSATYGHLGSIQFATVTNTAVINILVTYLLISRLYTQCCRHMVGVCLALGVHMFFVCLFVCLAMLGPHCFRGFSLVAVSGGYSSLRCEGFSLLWLPRLQSTGSVVVAHGLSCSTVCWLPGSGVEPMILYHWATWEFCTSILHIKIHLVLTFPSWSSWGKHRKMSSVV